MEPESVPCRDLIDLERAVWDAANDAGLDVHMTYMNHKDGEVKVVVNGEL